MKKIEVQWGPFDQKEIEFYIKELRNENGEIINGFQRQLIFNLFYKYFGDTTSIRAINSIDYVKLMIVAKRMLQNNVMAFLPYIIGGKVEKIVARKTLNKKELIEMEQSEYYPLIKEKFKNEKIEKQVFSTIATIITSTFRIIDYNNQELNGKIISVEPRIIMKEAQLYTLLI